MRLILLADTSSTKSCTVLYCTVYSIEGAIPQPMKEDHLPKAVLYCTVLYPQPMKEARSFLALSTIYIVVASRCEKR
jgi:hypothetical protein